MKLYLDSAYTAHSCLDRARELSKLDVNQQFVLTDNSAEAHAIVFVENTQFHDLGYKALLSHKLVRQYPDKVYMYNESDRSWPVLRGLYCSLASNLVDPDSQVAFPYLTTVNSGVSEIYGRKTKRKWLYSFVGSKSHHSRKPLLKLGRNKGQIVDTSEFYSWNPMQTSRDAFQKLYTDSIAASKFVLCPRGIGPASLRLFETMEAGRVPVIISDNWIAPPQVDWSFAVRLAQSQVNDIPDILNELEPEWQDRGEAARKAWKAAYAPEQMFNTMATAILGIRSSESLAHQSLRAKTLKWRVIAEQQIRNQLTDPMKGQLPQPNFFSWLKDNYFSYKLENRIGK